MARQFLGIPPKVLRSIQPIDRKVKEDAVVLGPDAEERDRSDRPMDIFDLFGFELPTEEAPADRKMVVGSRSAS